MILDGRAPHEERFIDVSWTGCQWLEIYGLTGVIGWPRWYSKLLCLPQCSCPMICITSCMPDLCFRITPQQQPTRILWQSKSTLHGGRQPIKHRLGQRPQIIRKSQCYTYPVRYKFPIILISSSSASLVRAKQGLMSVHQSPRVKRIPWKKGAPVSIIRSTSI